MLKQTAKLLDAQACVPNDPAHRKCIHGIVTRNREDANAIRHNYMLTLTNNAEASFLQSSDCVQMTDAG